MNGNAENALVTATKGAARSAIDRVTEVQRKIDAIADDFSDKVALALKEKEVYVNDPDLMLKTYELVTNRQIQLLQLKRQLLDTMVKVHTMHSDEFPRQPSDVPGTPESGSGNSVFD